MKGNWLAGGEVCSAIFRRKILLLETDDIRRPSPGPYYLTAALAGIAVSATNSFVPLYLSSLGFSYVVASLPLVMRGVGRFGFDSVSIYLMGLFRPGVVLCSGIAVAALGVLICGLFPFATAVVIAYFLIGAGMGAFHVTVRHIIFELGKKGGKGKAIGTLSVCIAVGPAVGILLGGVISDFAGYQSLFFTSAALIWIPFFLLYPLRDQKTDPEESTKRKGRLQWGIAREILSVSGVPLFCVCSFYVFFYQQAISLAVAFYATDSVGLSLSIYGLMRGLSQFGNMSGRYLGGRGSDRFGSPFCLLTGFLIVGVGFYLLYWSRGFWPLLAVVSFTYIGAGLVNVSSQVGIMSRVPSRIRGQTIGLYRAVGDIGMLLGPLVVTASLDNLGFLWSFTWLGTIPFLFALWVLLNFPKIQNTSDIN